MSNKVTNTSEPQKHNIQFGSKPKTRVTSKDEETSSARKGARFLALVVAAYLVFLIATGQMATFIDALTHVNRAWIFGAVICFVLYFVFGVIAYAIAVWLDPNSPVGIRDLMSVEASGIFFGNLTPMMAGAVPSQIVRLTRTGLDAGEASATQFTRFIMFQFGVVLFAALALLGKFEFFLHTYGDIVILNLFVFGMHAVELIVLFVVCLCPGFVKRFGNGFLRWIRKHNLVKDSSKFDDLINRQVDEFADAFKRAAVHIPSMALTLLVTMLQLAAFYTIPWFVLHAFGQTADFWACLAAGSMVQMVATAVPLPGGTGGVESGFALFYGPLFGSSATAGYLVWRIVTFFAPTILSAPLLGLRSNNPVSIRHRWDRMMGKHSGVESGNKRNYGGVGMSGATAAKLAAKAHTKFFSSAHKDEKTQQSQTNTQATEHKKS
ncbi:MAG: lysylphosphatidylglycerol synthase transmembrane domain-containing protein [Atopobium sp.]|uniref:lysylphosphatidylglycerol synthase transmembrane domain-containing protein n=1 Tax=Atopobium sp. TaxID=1872650 RepID=UPI002A7F2A57|nr:lysylphosphatidylglycerol synthase transmembrane domain-containing protein [Atopobium sp.]MDY4522422.1 lysylphosphatidylglycerol synthase transmembrane domain-containing protein [Atopobium sp.]